jgi:hypothetical protein
MGNSEHPILAEILNSIDQRGKCEIPFSRLKTAVFIQKNKDDWDTKAQILIWAASQRILYEYLEEDKETNVLFYRKAEH